MKAARQRVGIVGAGPVGLALALLLAKRPEQFEVTLHDARALDHDVGRDARTLALSLGSVQLLQRLSAWDSQVAQPIHRVHVSEQPTNLLDASVTIDAKDLGCESLGAVLPYGALVAPMQQRWLDEVQAAAALDPTRLRHRFGAAVQSVQPGAQQPSSGGEVEVVTADHINDRYDLVVIAEGGVFADQARKAIALDYAQTAWVGSVRLADGAPQGTAFERFTRHGPAALLPLPALPASSGPRAALVWCVNTNDDPVRALNDAQRIAVLNSIFPALAGRIEQLETPLKAFPLGLNAERTLVDKRAPIVRIGNAAQTLHPVAGQGLNLGFRDAFALCDALGTHANGNTTIGAALSRVEWQRAPDRWALIASTDFLARSFTWALPGADLVRGAAMAFLDRATPLKRLLAKQMMFGSR